MGLMDVFKNKSKNKISGVSSRRLKAVEGLDPELMDKAQFKDLVACLVQLGKTDVDITRITSRRYLKRLAYGTATVKSKAVKQLFDALDIDVDALDSDGYINGAMRKLIDAAAVAKKRGEASAQVDGALNVASLVFARYILERHPEYEEVLPVLAPVLGDIAE